MLKFVYIFSMFVLLTACNNTTPQEELEQTLLEMINLIDSGNGKKVIEEYAYFEDGKKPSIKEVNLEAVKDLKVYLLRAKDLKPNFSENNTLATYESTIFKRPMRFIKLNGKWHLMNK